MMTSRLLPTIAAHHIAASIVPHHEQARVPNTGESNADEPELTPTQTAELLVDVVQHEADTHRMTQLTRAVAACAPGSLALDLKLRLFHHLRKELVRIPGRRRLRSERLALVLATPVATDAEVCTVGDAVGELALVGNHMDKEDATAVAAAVRVCPHLRALNLHANELALNGAALLHGATSCVRLTTLNVADNELGPGCATALAAAIRHWPLLTTINCEYNHFGMPGTAVVAEALGSCPRLMRVWLGWNAIGCDGAVEVVAHLSGCKFLQYLDLKRNSIGPQGAKAIAVACAQWPMLSVLHLPFNKLGTVGCEMVVEGVSKWCAHLETLTLDSNQCNSADAMELAMYRWPKLKNLSLANNRYGPAATLKLALGMRHATALAKLVLKGNPIGTFGFLAVGRALQSARCIAHLDVTGCNVHADTDACIVQGILTQHQEMSRVLCGGAATPARPDTSLHKVCGSHEGTLGMVQWLVEAGGADLHAGDAMGALPLHHAVRTGKVDVAAWMLDVGVDVEARDNEGNALIHYAVANITSSGDTASRPDGLAQMLNMLIYAGASLHAANAAGATAAAVALLDVHVMGVRAQHQGTGLAQRHESIQRLVDGLDILTDAGTAVRFGIDHATGRRVLRRALDHNSYFQSYSRPNRRVGGTEAPLTWMEFVQQDLTYPYTVSDAARHKPLRGVFITSSMLAGWRTQNWLERVFTLGTAVSTVAGALLGVVDMVTDVQVMLELHSEGHFGWMASSLSFFVLTIVLSVAALARERRTMAACLQLIGMGSLYAAVKLLLEPTEVATVRITNPLPMLGKACIKQLHTLEAVTESGPQLVLQLLISLQLGYTNTLLVSISMSLLSLAFSFAASDKASLEAHSTRTRHRLVRVPLGLDLVTYIPGRWEGCSCVINRRRVAASHYFPTIMMFRLIEVASRVACAAWLAFVAGPWVLAGTVVALLTVVLWWMGSLPATALLFKRSRPRTYRSITQMLPPPDITAFRFLAVVLFTLFAFPGYVQPAPVSKHAQVSKKKKRPHRRVSVAGWTGRDEGSKSTTPAVLAVVPPVPTAGREATASRYPGRAHDALVAAPTMLTLKPWMQTAWTPDWTLSPLAFCVMRTIEHLIVLAVVYVTPDQSGGLGCNSNVWLVAMRNGQVVVGIPACGVW